MDTVYGRLKLVGLTGKKRGPYRLAKFICACGASVIAEMSIVKCGRKKSCGCLAKELSGERMRQQATTHGMSYSPEHQAWRDMIQRCRNPRCRNWKNYGARGISVCAKWRESFEAFFSHVGLRPSSKHSLDRVNNDGNYEPGNVRWTTKDVQGKNRRARLMCVRGHKYSEHTIRVRRHGKYLERVCGECERMHSREKYKRQKGTN